MILKKMEEKQKFGKSMLLLDLNETKIRILCKNPYVSVPKSTEHPGKAASLTCEGHGMACYLYGWGDEEEERPVQLSPGCFSYSSNRELWKQLMFCYTARQAGGFSNS